MNKAKVITELIGESFKDVYNDNNDRLVFIGDKSYAFLHHQDCCESVVIEDICGDLKDLIDSPILVADETSKYENEDSDVQWTFYNFATLKGHVNVRWRGESHYYSTSVHFESIPWHATK